jgi:NitT/TauT family transport system ATP-binding protein
MKMVIQLKDVHKQYPHVSGQALRGVDLQVFAGEFLVLVGPSGCGKSTLIKLITGLELATSGEVERPEAVSMVFQSGALFPWLSAAGNIEIALQAKGLSPALIRRKTRQYLQMVGLQELSSKFPRELSGGQRQRVGLARALAVDPQVLVLDEPFAALDIKTTESLHQDILEIWRQTGMTIVMVSHSIEEAVTLADRVVLMTEGKIARQYEMTELPRPRREQAESFIHEVHLVRDDFLRVASPK